MTNLAMQILVLDESSNHSEQMVKMLRSAGTVARVQRVDTESELSKLLSDESSNWDLIVSDNQHPHIQTNRAKRLIEDAGLDLPLVLIGEKYDAEIVASAIELGAADIVDVSDEARMLHVLAREADGSKLRRAYRAQQKQLEELENRYKQLLSSSPDAIAYVSAGIFLECNQQFAQLLGIDAAKQLEATPLIDHLGASCIEQVKQALKAAEAGTQQQVSIIWERRDGSEMRCSALLTAANYDSEPCIQLFIRNRSNAPAGNNVASASLGSAPDCSRLEQGIEKGEGVVLYIGIDKVAQLRARLGLITANRAIVAMGDYIQQQASTEHGSFCHFGEASYLVFRPDLSLATARDVATQILCNVEEHMLQVDELTIQLTCSIGIASVTPDSTVSLLIDNAFKAMFEARSTNDGNAYKLFTSDIKAGVAGNTGLTLDDAIELNRFSISYQPLVGIRESGRDYYEVYLRMLDEEGEEISPAHFMPAFTEREFTTKLDRWVLLETFKKLSSAIQTNPDARLIVNLTANALNDDKLASWIAVALKAADVNPKHVVFQFLEEHVTTYLMRAIKFLSDIRELGSATSITRFGEATDSARLLEKVSVDYVKLAPSFIAELTNNGNSEPLRHIISQVRNAGPAVIVAYVESAASMAQLWQMDIAYIQGFYIAPPSPEMSYEFSDF